jgi:hypothetical protein
MKQLIEISRIMLRTEGNYAILEVEVDGKWVTVLRERVVMPDGSKPVISHIVEPAGIRQRMTGEAVRA